MIRIPPALKATTLVEAIREAAIAYYVDSKPLITDGMFDFMVDELRSTCPDHPILSTTAWGASSKDWDVPHWSHIGGLTDWKIDQLPMWTFDQYYSVGAKYDGLTGVARYDATGLLIDVLSRGDGKTGKDITAMALATGKVPARIENGTGRPVQIRGEFVLKLSVFKEMGRLGLCKTDTHPRNVAAGCINGSDPIKAMYVDFVAFSIITIEESGDEKEHDEITQYSFCTANGIQFCNYVRTKRSDLVELCKEFWKELEETYDYPLDGLVFRGPEGRIKVKFPAKDVQEMEVVVNLRKTRTGRIIPHCSFKEAKFIGGCWIDNATLNNIQWCRDRQIWTGAKVMVRRANEIIPQIIEIVESADVPTNEELARLVGLDPSEVFMDGTDLCFQSEDHQTYQVIKRLIKDSFPKGMAGSAFDRIYEGLLDCFYIQDEPLYLADVHKFMSIMVESTPVERTIFFEVWFDMKDATAEKCHEFVNHLIAADNRSVYLSDILYYLSIPGWGDAKIDKVIASYLESIEGMELTGPSMKNLLINEFLDEVHHRNAMDLFSIYGARIVFQSRRVAEAKPAPSKDLPRFSMTGKIVGYKKKDFAAKVEGRAVWDDSSYSIMVSDDTRQSAKMVKAVSKGILPMKSEEFLQHLDRLDHMDKQDRAEEESHELESME